jgi:hypothetical protein
LIEDTTNATHQITQSVASTAQGLVTLSANIATLAGATRTIELLFSDATGYAEAFFNPAYGGRFIWSGDSGGNGYIVATGINAITGGYHIWATFRVPQLETLDVGIRLRNDAAGTPYSYAGDGTSGMEVWGTQLRTGEGP